MSTIVLKANVVPMQQFQERENFRNRPSKNRLDAMRKAIETLEPLQVSLSDPMGDFLVEVLEHAPAIAISNQYTREYDQWLDDVEASQYDIPEDFNL